MAIRTSDFCNCVVVPTLNYLQKYSLAARNLLLGTCAQETEMGTYLRQINNGPGLGPYSMQDATQRDIVNRFLLLPVNKALKLKVDGLVSNAYLYGDRNQELMVNMAYATALARIRYMYTDEPLPDANDIQGLANYWKQHYNTPDGSGTIEQFMERYKTYVQNQV